MPIHEYGCNDCGEIDERLFLAGQEVPSSVACPGCGSQDTVKLISRVNYKMAKKAKYSDDFIEKTMPSLKHRKETSKYFQEGKGSDESKAFNISERIGEQIDRQIQHHFKKTRD